MTDHLEDSSARLPLLAEMEARFGAKVVVFEDRDIRKPGGMCGCCGGGPNASPDWRGDPWYIYRAGICDGDGVYYAMLCEGCLDELRSENRKRPQTLRDQIAEEVTDLLGDDTDGAQSMMDDWE
jgi:hypothetical protein